MVLTVCNICQKLVVNRNDFFIEALLRKNAYVAVVCFLFVKKRLVPLMVV
jgi:hypothetical protein